jgi:hypothetical protein
VFLTADIGVQAGGVIFRTLERIPGLGRLLQATKVLEEKGKVSVLRGRLGPNGIMRWHNASRTAFIEASEAAANVVLQGDVSLRFEALNSFLAKGLGLLGVRSLPLLQFEFFQFAEPFRLLREESLTVNGMPVGSGSNPVQVTVGSPLSVRATVERDFISLSPIQLILETSVHQEFPHRGEIWAGQEMLGSLTRASDFALTGSLQMNQALCARAPATNPLTLKLLAYNRMFHAIETPNYVGKFQLACDNVDQIVIECDRTAFTTGDGQSTAQCTASLDGEARVPAGTRLRWNSTNSGVATIVSSGDGLSAVLTARSPGAASITATLVAGATELVTSNAVAIVVRDAAPPMVELTSDSPSTVRPGDTIQVTVRATDEVGVARIRLEATGEAVLNSVQEAECDGQTANACERSFGVQLKSSGFTDLEVTVTATATDGADNQGQSAPLVFTIEDDCPVVSITSPANGATIVPGIDATLVQVVAVATDPIGVRSFAYSASGPTLVSQVNIPNLPFGDPLPTSPDLRFNFEVQPAVDIARVTERTITISVSATDDENPSCPAETITVVAMPDTRPPSVAIQRPAAGGTVNAGEGVTVMGDAVDNLDADTGVREIRFSASGEALKSPASSSTTLPMPERTTSISFDFAVKEAEDLSEIEDKTIRLTVEAFDEAGNSQEETIVVTAIGDLEGECTGRLTAVPSSGYIGDAVVVSVVIDPPLDTEITRVSTTNPGGVFELQPQGGGVFSTTLFYQGTGSFVLSFTAFDAEGMARCSGSIGAESLGQRPGSGSAASAGEQTLAAAVGVHRCDRHHVRPETATDRAGGGADVRPERDVGAAGEGVDCLGRVQHDDEVGDLRADLEAEARSRRRDRRRARPGAVVGPRHHHAPTALPAEDEAGLQHREKGQAFGVAQHRLGDPLLRHLLEVLQDADRLIHLVLHAVGARAPRRAQQQAHHCRRHRDSKCSHRRSPRLLGSRASARRPPPERAARANAPARPPPARA